MRLNLLVHTLNGKVIAMASYTGVLIAASLALLGLAACTVNNPPPPAMSTAPAPSPVVVQQPAPPPPGGTVVVQPRY